MPAYLVDTPKDEISDIVAINVNATLRVTYTILPGMIKRYVHYIGCYEIKDFNHVQETRLNSKYWFFCWFYSVAHAGHLFWNESILSHFYKCLSGGS